MRIITINIYTRNAQFMECMALLFNSMTYNYTNRIIELYEIYIII